MRKIPGNLAMIAALLVVLVAMPTFAGEVVHPQKVLRPTASGVTPPMSEYVAPEPEEGRENYEIPNKPSTELPTLPGAVPTDRVMGEGFISPDSGVLAPAPTIGFDGNNSDDNQAVIGGRLAPPDTQGAVGMQYYVQWVNLTWSIYDKATGAEVVGPLPGNSLWSAGMPGSACANTNDGDPITLYDHAAGRWFMSQFALPNYPSGPFYTCLAVSETTDPTGAWYVWEYEYSTTMLNDYPKFGVWPDGYYMTVNEFGNAYSATTVFDRTAMVAGDPSPAAQYFYIEDVQPAFPQPTNWDGGPPPPAGAPNYNVAFYDDAWGNPADVLFICEFHVDWATPGNSTFSCPDDADAIDLTAAGLSFDSDLCGYSRDCIPQPGTSQRVDTISNRLMFPANYRNLMATLGYEVMVLTHTVDVDGADHAGIRWYELRNTGSGWFVEDGGSFAPDSDNRFMGSGAADQNGNIGIVYSISSSSTFPSVGYTARLVTDDPGTMQTEQVLVAGGGSQEGVNRWGDYAAMHVDPDGCTFWGTAEYVAVTGSYDWDTYIGAFTMPGCTPSGFGTLDGMVYNAITMDPIGGALVEAGGFTTYTQPDGTYAINLPVDTYDVTASAFGFAENTAMGVVITEGMPTTQDFALDPVGSAFLDGYVTGELQGWPLYAMIEISTGNGDAPVATVFTDPFSGYYIVELPQSTPYELMVTSMIAGYDPAMRAIVLGPAGQTESFVLNDDGSQSWARCILDGGIVEDFEGDFPPPGWQSVDNIGSGMMWMRNDQIPAIPRTGDGFTAAADSDATCGTAPWDTTLYSPFVQLPAAPNKGIRFDSNFQDFAGSGQAWFDISTDGGMTWSNLLYLDVDDPSGGVAREFDLTAYAGMLVQFRWTYTDDGDTCAWYWHIDNVSTFGLPAPPPPPVFSEDFESWPPADWLIAIGGGDCNFESTATTGRTNLTGGTGEAADADSDWCGSGNNMDADLVTPTLDLSGETTVFLEFKWDYNDLSAGGDFAMVDVSIDDGASYTALVTWDADSNGTYVQDISGIVAGESQVRIRFHYEGAYDWWFEVDDFAIYDADPTGDPPPEPEPDLICEVVPGSLVEGFVSDGNTGDGLNGADVWNDIGGATMTMPTPDDPNIPDGFYYMFTPVETGGDGPSTRTFWAAYPNYAESMVEINLVPDTVNQIDFALGAGWLELVPDFLGSYLYPGGHDHQPMAVNNYGTLEAEVMINTTLVPSTWPHLSPVRDVQRGSGPASVGRAPAGGEGQPSTPNPNLVLATVEAFGVDMATSTLVEWPDVTVPGAWNPIAGGMATYWAGDFLLGDFSKLYVISDANEFGTVDTTTGAFTSIGTATPGGGESWTGMTASVGGVIYATSVACGVNSTLFTIDPGTGTATAIGSVTNGTCMIDLGINAAGELYGVDIVTDTLLMIDPGTGAGTVIGPTGIDANFGQGMDFDEVSGTLYWAAFNNGAFQSELRIIDTMTGASTLVGAFPAPGATQVDSFAIHSFAGGGGLPWLVLTPDEGIVPPMGNLPIEAQFLADEADHYGLYRATISVMHGTPYDVNDAAVCFTKSFMDMTPATFGESRVHSIAGARITTGCGFGNFCPTDDMTRGTMALWLLLSKYGPDYSPPPCTGIFGDVLCETTPNADYIEALYDEGITSGCNADPLLYCPNNPVTRDQMAVFLIRTLEGSDYVPPDCAGLFIDVACPGGFAVKWVEDLFNRGITAGCGAGYYCPKNDVSRAEMAVFVGKTFQIPRCGD